MMWNRTIALASAGLLLAIAIAGCRKAEETQQAPRQPDAPPAVAPVVGNTQLPERVDHYPRAAAGGTRPDEWTPSGAATRASVMPAPNGPTTRE